MVAGGGGKRGGGGRAERATGNNLDGSPITFVSWPSAPSGQETRWPLILQQPSFLLEFRPADPYSPLARLNANLDLHLHRRFTVRAFFSLVGPHERRRRKLRNRYCALAHGLSRGNHTMWYDEPPDPDPECGSRGPRYCDRVLRCRRRATWTERGKRGHVYNYAEIVVRRAPISTPRRGP